MLSVICPIYNEEKYIAHCIESILHQDYPHDDWEILMVDGMSSDKTRDIVKAFSRQYPFIRLIDNPKKIVPCAMNMGIKEAKGDVILRLDAHASYPTNYFSVLVRRLYELDADNVGAVCRTDVLHKNPLSLAIREVLSNPFGVGNSVFRTGVSEVKLVDTVPFGCWKRTTFDKFGMYDERLTRNQDFELNRRITEGGGKIYIVPDTYSTYYARETLASLWRQNYLNGIWGIRTIAFTGRADTLALRHYVPMFFVLSLLLPLMASLLFGWLSIIAAASLAAYLLLISIVSVLTAAAKHLNALLLMISFATLHISNGCGMLVSIFTTHHYVKHAQ